MERITFRNEQSGFTVLEINTGEELVTAVGSLSPVSVGESVRLSGRWDSHATFGPQFKVESAEITAPNTAAAILRYLSSGAVRGIGPSLAKRLVCAFGDNTLAILETSPGRLSKLKGITPKKAEEISEEFKKKFGVREVVLRLGEYGIGTDEALLIFSRLGVTAPDLVLDNPYVLCDDDFAVSFERADAIARERSLDPSSPNRVKAGILHILRHNLQNGHTCLPYKKLAETAVKMLAQAPEAVESELDGLLESQAAVMEGGMVFLPALYQAEAYSAERLGIIARTSPPAALTVDRDINEIERALNIKYGALQREAIHAAVQNGIMVLTGGPGTGKTTTLNGIIKLFELQKVDVLLAAPTGRAAKRMSEVTGKEAKTVHRLLEVVWSDTNRPAFLRNERNPLTCGALILDELSMMDALLFEGLLRALPLGCRLIMVGDSDQLPSVGAGNILADVIASQICPVICLRKVFRQAMESLIVANAHLIVQGDPPQLARRDSDFFLLKTADKQKALETVVDLTVGRLPQSYGFSPLSDIQVLCPSRKWELGSGSVNEALRAALNPAAPRKNELKCGFLTLREGDKVMQSKNNYNVLWNKEDGTRGQGVFNGDIGVITQINKAAGVIDVLFDDRRAEYGAEEATALELAYAITVHKSQGSEFPCVIIPVLNVPNLLAYRNLLYTAVTRARKLLILVGTQGDVLKMIKNNKKMNRYTYLRRFIERAREE
ncbi:MAG: ATP-dependent RecD-like DNA helicase [Oscillospiraceae bacterium]|nr:ATP-dependent RecD-like DNA helicase [Oscillospiraceae bacterium]